LAIKAQGQTDLAGAALGTVGRTVEASVAAVGMVVEGTAARPEVVVGSAVT